MAEDIAVEAASEENSFLTRKFMLSCVVLFIIAIGLVILTFNYFSADDPSAAPVASAEKCDLPASDQTDLVGIPEHGWVLIGAGESAIPVPKTDDHGPAMNDSGVYSCWAQSPMGAVSAAMTFAAMGSAGEEYALAEKLTAPGAERDRLLAETPQDTEPAGSVVIEGFRLVDYDKDAAEVTVVMGDGTNLAAATIDVAWVDGDWRYDPPSTLEPEFSYPTSMDGYTEIGEVE